MFRRKSENWDDLDIGPQGQADAESAESIALWASGLLQDPIDEHTYREADEREYYGDLAFSARRFAAKIREEFLTEDLEDVHEL